MAVHAPLLNGLVYFIRITKKPRKQEFLGTLEDKATGESIFDDVFPSYKDAYWALMDIDKREYVASLDGAVANTCS